MTDLWPELFDVPNSNCAVHFAPVGLNVPIPCQASRILVFAAILALAKPGFAADCPVYADDTDGLTRQFTALFDDYKQNSSAGIHTLLECFAVPSAELPELSGDHYDAELASRYAKAFDGFESSIISVLEKWARDPGTSIRIERRDPVAGPVQNAAPKSDPHAYKFVVAATGRGSQEWVTSFIFRDGSFRFVGAGAYPLWQQPITMKVATSKEVTPPRLLRRVTPVYPQGARRQHIEGIVKLRATIGEDGSVRDIQALSGDSLLVESAVAAVKEWRYQPALLAGQPVAVRTIIDVQFVLGH